MFIKLISACILILFFAALNFAQSKPAAIQWQKNYNVALDLAKKSGKPMLIDFTAVWCPPCRTMEQVFWSRPEIIALSEEFVCVSVDFDRDRQTVSRFGVASVPHIVLTDPWGNMLNFHHGFGRGSSENALRLIMKTVQKDFSEIKEPYSKFEKDKENAEALIKIGEFYRKINSLFLSNTFFKRALKTKQLETDAALRENILIATANNYLKMRDFDEAERIFKDSLQEFPGGSNNEKAFFGLVMINIHRRKLTDAENVFEQMKAKFPDSQTTQQAAQNLQEAKASSN